jgi:hypothetical protein
MSYNLETMKTLFNMEQKIKELESTINKLTTITTEQEIKYNKQSKQIEIQNVKLYKQNEQLNERLIETNEILFFNKISELENKYYEQYKQMNKLKIINNNYETINNEQNIQINELKIINNNQNNQINKLEHMINELKTINNEQNIQINELKIINNNQNNQINKLEHMINELKTITYKKISELESKCILDNTKIYDFLIKIFDKHTLFKYKIIRDGLSPPPIVLSPP